MTVMYRKVNGRTIAAPMRSRDVARLLRLGWALEAPTDGAKKKIGRPRKAKADVNKA